MSLDDGTNAPAQAVARPGRLSGLRGRVPGTTLKWAGVGAILLGFLIFLGEVHYLVSERIHMRGIAEAAVESLWGPSQTLTGPVLIVERERELGSALDARFVTVRQALTPAELAIEAVLKPEIRKRGLFDVPVYVADMRLSGRFDLTRLDGGQKFGLPSPRDGFLVLDLSGPAGIVSNPEVSWEGAGAEVLAATPKELTDAIGSRAITMPLSGLTGEGRFELHLRFRGTGDLQLVPTGSESNVAVSSSWPSPSFLGSRSPERHGISEEGFQAHWHLAPFGRGFPPSWDIETGSDGWLPVGRNVDSLVGVSLIETVDPYRMAERALKYGMLFAVYTFGAFLVFELVFGRRMHILHYGLAGASVGTFFLLLLSLSELIGFAPAYLLGALGVVAQVGLFARAVIGDRWLVLGFSALLAVLYAGLYGLLRLEDTALVTGSVAMFAVIGVAMWLTRGLAVRGKTADAE